MIQTSFYLVVFGHLYGRAGDYLCIRETQSDNPGELAYMKT